MYYTVLFSMEIQSMFVYKSECTCLTKNRHLKTCILCAYACKHMYRCIPTVDAKTAFLD